MAEVFHFGGRIDSHGRVEFDACALGPNATTRAICRGVMPRPIPVVEKISKPVRPNDWAESPASNCSGSTPMHTRLLR